MSEEYTYEYVEGLLDQIYDYQETLNNLKLRYEDLERLVRDTRKNMRDILWELERI